MIVFNLFIIKNKNYLDCKNMLKNFKKLNTLRVLFFKILFKCYYLKIKNSKV